MTFKKIFNKRLCTLALIASFVLCIVTPAMATDEVATFDDFKNNYWQPGGSTASSSNIDMKLTDNITSNDNLLKKTSGSVKIDGQTHTWSGTNGVNKYSGIHLSDAGVTHEIKNITMDGFYLTDAKGAAVYLESGTLDVTDVTFSGNESVRATYAGFGGAISDWSGAIINFTGITKFTDNKAKGGGAIYNAGNITFDKGSITYFTGNEATTSGGAIHNDNGAITFNGKTSFRNNMANSVKNDIYTYKGTLNFGSGSVTTFDGGIKGEVSTSPGTINFNEGATITMNPLDWKGEARSFNTIFTISKQNFYANGGTFVINTDLVHNSGDRITLENCTITAKEGSSPLVYLQVAYDPSVMSGGTVSGNDYVFLTLKDVTDADKLTVTAKEYKYEEQGLTVSITPKIDKDSTADGTINWKIISLTGVLPDDPNPPVPVIVVSETAKAVSDTANVMNFAWLETVNNLQKRLGDLRGGEASDMAWARFQRSNDDYDGARKFNVSGNLYQVGYDFALKNQVASRGYFGVSLERFDGTQSYQIGGGDVASTSLGAYYTKIYDSGHYFDFIFRYGRLESDTQSYDATLTIPVLTKLDYAMNSVTLSGEYGYRANLGKSGLYLEPQAEFIYGYMAGAKATSSTNYLADIDSTNHFVTRLGLAFGQRVKNFNYYLRGSYYHDFAGTTNIKYGVGTYKQDCAQNWWEVSLGGGWNISKLSYFYAELTKHFKDVSNSLNFNVGFRFTL